LGRVDRDGVRLGHAHHLRNVLLANVAVEKQLDGLALAAGQLCPARVQILNVLEAVLTSVRTDQPVYAFGLEQCLKSLEVAEKLAEQLVIQPRIANPLRPERRAAL
jgi:hypothetical protein